MFYHEGVDAMGQAQDATEPAPKRQRTFVSSFGELRELHKMKDDGVIDGQEFERLKGPRHVRAGVIPASRTDTAAHTVSGSCQKHAAAPRRRAHVTFALVHVPRDDGLRYRIHMLMQTRAAPMPYMCI